MLQNAESYSYLAYQPDAQASASEVSLPHSLASPLLLSGVTVRHKFPIPVPPPVALRGSPRTHPSAASPKGPVPSAPVSTPVTLTSTSKEPVGWRESLQFTPSLKTLSVLLCAQALDSATRSLETASLSSPYKELEFLAELAQGFLAMSSNFNEVFTTLTTLDGLPLKHRVFFQYLDSRHAETPSAACPPATLSF